VLGKILLTLPPRTTPRVLANHLLIPRMRFFERLGQARGGVRSVIGVMKSSRS
jgi:hypothetical protein